MASSLAPALLLSMPQMADPNFARSVVLLCTHNDEGAFGLVVNRPLTTTGHIVVNLDPPVSTERQLNLWIGGPVEPESTWMLVSNSEIDGEPPLGMSIGSGLALSNSPDLLRKMIEPNPPSNVRLVIGYAGWGPGQLEAELHESAWLLSDVHRELIFDTPAEQMWERAIRRLGADPGQLHTSRGVH
jgi:putative transcriptional regulator